MRRFLTRCPDGREFIARATGNLGRLHVAGNVLGLAAIGLAIVERQWWALVLAPVLANGFAWVGHWFFQRNRPGVFHYPVYGMVGSWRMTWEFFFRRR